MRLSLCNVISITTICLVFSMANAWPKKDGTEIVNEKETNHLKENEPKIDGEGKTTPGIINLLTGEPGLSILNIAFDNSEKSIDILKSVVSSEASEHKENATRFYDGKVKDLEKDFCGKNSADVGNNSCGKTEVKKVNAPVPNPVRNEGNETNSSEANKENSTGIFKGRAGTEATMHVNADKEYSNDATTAKNTGQDLDEDLRVSNETSTGPEDEIILSEISNLSRDSGGESAPGQTITFQQSSRNLKGVESNAAGKAILQNTTEICGYLLGKRVSFAEPTTLMEFPWTALLMYNTHIRYHCGGSLITKRYVLTAAHCVAQQFYELSGVRLGEYDISEPVDCAPDVAGSQICATTVDADVDKIIVHHDYSHLSFKNDIALLRLDKEYFGRSFYPICLTTPETTYESKTATVAGWGATEKDIRSSILLKATVPIFDISKCSEIYRYKMFNDSTEICASGANEVDVCKGDSGGAIFYSRSVKGRDKYFQLGIISLGVRGCGDKRFLPAVFTKLNGFYKWIEYNLEY